MRLRLNRIEIESVGSDPVRLAQAIHLQMPSHTGAVPVHHIARVLDIDEIRERPLRSFEGCLITDRYKDRGAILVNASSSPRRRRYSIAHELGHFLNERHAPSETEGFLCTSQDMANPRGAERHLRQEREANMFAIELLAPRRLLEERLDHPPDLAQVLAIANELEISREAAARRYVALHTGRLAVVFSSGGRVRYVTKREEFPRTVVWANSALPPLPSGSSNNSGLSAFVEVEPGAWISHTQNATLSLQTLYQANGFAMSLLVLDGKHDETRAWANGMSGS